MMNTTIICDGKVIGLVAALLFGACQFLIAQDEPKYDVSLIPDSLKTDALRVIRYEKTKTTIEDHTSTLGEVTRVVTWLKAPTEREVALVLADSDFEKVKKMSARVFDSKGKLVSTSSKVDIEKYGSNHALEFTNTLVKVLPVALAEVPFTIEYTFKTEQSAFFMLDSWRIQKLGESVQHTEYELVTPSDYKYDWKAMGIEFNPTIDHTSTNRKQWVAKLTGLKAAAKESHLPFESQDYRVCHFAPHQIQLNEYKGSMKSWSDFGKFIYDLNKDQDELPPADIARVNALVLNAPTDKEKIDILYRHLQESCRYVSVQIEIGGWRTFPASYVAGKKYGDCKALSNYMKAMLKAVGVESHLAVIEAGADTPRAYDETFPYPAFNHMVLYIPKEDIWLECTADYLPVGYMSDFTAGCTGLVCTPEGGILKKVPALKPTDNAIASSATLDFSNGLDSILVDIKRKYQGESSQMLTAKIADNKETFKKEYIERLGLQASKVNTMLHSQPKPGVTEVQVQVQAMNYGSKSGKRVFIPLLKTHQFTEGASSKTIEARKLPFYVCDCRHWTDTIQLKLPPNYTIESLPGGQKFESPFGSYDFSIQKIDHQTLIVYRQLIQTPVGTCQPEQFADWVAFKNKIKQLDAVQLVAVSQMP